MNSTPCKNPFNQGSHFHFTAAWLNGISLFIYSSILSCHNHHWASNPNFLSSYHLNPHHPPHLSISIQIHCWHHRNIGYTPDISKDIHLISLRIYTLYEFDCSKFCQTIPSTPIDNIDFILYSLSTITNHLLSSVLVFHLSWFNGSFLFDFHCDSSSASCSFQDVATAVEVSFFDWHLNSLRFQKCTHDVYKEIYFGDFSTYFLPPFLHTIDPSFNGILPLPVLCWLASCHNLCVLKC